MARFVLLLTCLNITSWAQPQIYYRGVTNSASYLAAGLPGASIARGATFSIFGANLGPSTSPALSSYPLQTTLGGVSVTVTQGTTTVNAIPVFVSGGLVTTIMPSNAPTGMVSVRVIYNQHTSNPAPVSVVTSSFGAFALNSAGLGPGIVQNIQNDGTIVSNLPGGAAQPGQTVVLWGTGLGAGLGADNATPTVGNLAATTEVWVGGVSANVVYHGRTSCCAGIDQINFAVPANAPLGCWVPVMVRTEGMYVANAVTMSISADGSPCTEPANPVGSKILSGGKIGAVLSVHQDVIEDSWVQNPIEAVSDAVVGVLAQQPGGAFPYNRIFSLPPAGACEVQTSTGTLAGSIMSDYLGSTTKFLDAGSPWTVGASGGSSQSAGTFFNPGGLIGALGYSISQITGLPSTVILNPGNFTLSAPGGADVNQFQASFTMPALLGWSSALGSSGIEIDRTQPFTINWTGVGSPYTVFIAGGNADYPTASTAVFLCTAPPGATSFTIPAQVLEALPASRSNPAQSLGAIYAGAWNLSSPAMFSASGLDFGAIISTVVRGRTVVFE